MMFDAAGNFSKPLTKERLFNWHYALFPSGRSGMHKNSIGSWRDGSDGPMQVVSGPVGRETIHFQAPSADKIDKEIKLFFYWFNQADKTNYVLKAAVAHLWFLNALLKALNSSEQTLISVLRKHNFWTMHLEQIHNDRQKKILNKLLNGFNGNLTSSKWAKIAKCSQDTALRDIQDLITKGILEKTASGGRSTHYILKNQE